MNNENTIANHTGRLAQDAQALFEATAEVADEKVKQARERLKQAMERAKQMGRSMQENMADGAKKADRMIRENPYQALALSVGVGALIGILLSRK